MPSLRLAASIGAIVLSAVVLAGPAFAAGKSPDRPAMPQKLADCVAAVRDMPSLDAKRLPGVRFKVVTEPAGWERDPSGKQVELVYPHGTETAVLPGGVRLRTDLGGCKDYSSQYEFDMPGKPASSGGADLLSKASKLLEEIAPANIDPIVPLHALSLELARKALDPEAVKALAAGGLEGRLEGGTPDESYLVEVERHPDRTIIRVSYSVHL